MELLHQATVLNNMGAHMFDAGNASGAIQAFQQAIHAMKACTKMRLATATTTKSTLPSMVDGSNSGSSPMKSDLYLYQSLHCIHDVVLENTRPSPTGTNRPTPSHRSLRGGDCGNGISHSHHYHYPKGGIAPSTISTHQCYVHDRALMLPTTIAATSWEKTGLELLERNATIILMLNYSTACHQLGLRKCQSRVVLQALRVYELIVEMILPRLNTPPSSQEPTYLRVVLCLALNNMACIHYDVFCDYENGMICVAYMQKLLKQHTTYMDHTALQFIPKRDWDDVKLNALFLQAPSTAQAA